MGSQYYISCNRHKKLAKSGEHRRHCSVSHEVLRPYTHSLVVGSERQQSIRCDCLCLWQGLQYMKYRVLFIAIVSHLI